ncbi:MmgE/PrpD family protein [Ramlibacter sp.]|uniref:MmgE/PrpD family protein n=1 Tax=Ramlibacter sp. TaxID=1917967 RepID=UPI003D0CD50B
MADTRIDAGQVLAEYVTRARFEDFPATAIAATKRSIFDTVGVMLAGGGPAANAKGIVKMLAAWGGTPSSTVIGHEVKLPPPHAAFANAAMAHQYDFDDAHDAGATHPSGNSFAAALALAEERGANGRDLLTATLLGNEIVCRAGIAGEGALYDIEFLWPAITAIWGSTTAAGRLMGLDADTLRAAYGHTLHQAGTTLECLYRPGSDMRGFRDGLAARNGVTAAFLAEAGLRGDAEPFEGKYGFFGAFFKGRYNRERLVGELGKRYEVERITIKPWPSARETHATLQALLELRDRHRIEPDAIEKVVMRVGATNLGCCEPAELRRRPTVRMDALFSLPYGGAVALTHGHVRLSAFQPEGMKDERVLALAQRMTWEVNEAQSHDGTIERGDVAIHLRNGDVLRHEVRHAMGHPDHPVSDDVLMRKFLDCAALAPRPPTEAQAREFWNVVQDLESLPAKAFGDALRSLSS